jgi:dihydroflavonol-4-reductase
MADPAALPTAPNPGDRIFLTGATGFVGANLAQLLLDQGYCLRLLVRPSAPRTNLPAEGPRVEYVVGDLQSAQLTEWLRGCRYLFHVAAHYTLWQRDRDLLYQANVLGTRAILAAAKVAGVERTVYTSSVAAIGVSGSERPVDEGHQSPVDQLVGHYKKSKYWAEQEAIAAAQSGQDIVIVNPSTPIGPRDIKPTPTGDIILRFLQRRMPAYVDTGLNLIHVEDVAWGHLLALERGISGQRYILGHQNLSLKEMLGLLSEITGLPAPSRTVPLWLPLAVAWVEEMLLAKVGYQPTVPIDGVRMSAKPMYYDASRAIAELGLPQTPIDRALREAVEWFEKNVR